MVASEPQYAEHLAPLSDIRADATLVASTRDLRDNPGAVYMDHGVGLQWHGHRTLDSIRADADYVLAPNGFMADRYHAEGIDARVIGTPKLDALTRIPYAVDGPVAVSFHWISSRYTPILRDYRAALEHMAPIIGHGHPRARPLLERFWGELGVEFVEDFREVVERASVYVCDHSSTIYEWAALGRPVVLMDYPGQRDLIRVSSGLRYDFHADVGPHATPDTLFETVRRVRPDAYWTQRYDATEALFPYLGVSVDRAEEVLRGRAA